MPFPCIGFSSVNRQKISGQVIIILCVKSLTLQPFFHIPHAIICLFTDYCSIRSSNPDYLITTIIGIMNSLTVILFSVILLGTNYFCNPAIPIIKQTSGCSTLIRQMG